MGNSTTSRIIAQGNSTGFDAGGNVFDYMARAAASVVKSNIGDLYYDAKTVTAATELSRTNNEVYLFFFLREAGTHCVLSTAYEGDATAIGYGELKLNEVFEHLLAQAIVEVHVIQWRRDYTNSSWVTVTGKQMTDFSAIMADTEVSAPKARVGCTIPHNDLLESIGAMEGAASDLLAAILKSSQPEVDALVSSATEKMRRVLAVLKHAEP